jgi:hypothetical protein
VLRADTLALANSLEPRNSCVLPSFRGYFCQYSSARRYNWPFLSLCLFFPQFFPRYLASLIHHHHHRKGFLVCEFNYVYLSRFISLGGQRAAQDEEKLQELHEASRGA